MKILGVDPGLRTSGYAVIERDVDRRIRIIDAGTITSDNALPMARRLRQIQRDIDAVFREHAIDLMAIEQLYAHYKHPRTAILMGHARGVFLMTAADHDVNVHDFSATRIKKSLTGNGRAGKQQMQRAAAVQLGLTRLPEPADVADALAVALCCINEINLQEALS